MVDLLLLELFFGELMPYSASPGLFELLLLFILLVSNSETLCSIGWVDHSGLGLGKCTKSCSTKNKRISASVNSFNSSMSSKEYVWRISSILERVNKS